MTNNKLTIWKISSNLFVYWITHALVDLICAWVIFSIWKMKLVSADTFFYLVVLYNILAFWFQSIFWIITDFIKKPRETAFLWCLFTGISGFIFQIYPIIAIIFAWIWNALFHVWWWSISLNLTPNKATAPWIYVAPWAMGLFIGTFLWKWGNFNALVFIIILFIFSILMYVINNVEIDYNKKEKQLSKLDFFWLIIIFILLSVTIRSFIWLSIAYPWKSDFNLVIILISAVVLWKWLWWILADKFWWIRVWVGALVLSIPFLLFGYNNAISWIIWMFLFNITMPITLVALSNILPGRSAFAFWLTCIALLMWALPVLFGVKINDFTFITLIVIISAIVLYYWLKLISKNKDFRYDIRD